MGYTHYWQRKRILPPDLFRAAVTDAQTLCTALPIPLGDAEGKEQPLFDEQQICFNGHIDSGRLTTIQHSAGLVWPSERAHGVANASEAGACAGAGWFAGPRADSRVLGPGGDGSYETFHVSRVRTPRYNGEQSESGWWFGFCKTNYRPYDLCVQGCLIILQHHLGGELFRVDSDGTSEQWCDALAACQNILGYGADWGEGKLAPVQIQSPSGAADTVFRG